MTSPDRVVLPRGLIFLASLWLIASWLVAIGVRPPVQPSSASYTPGVRSMLLCVSLGLTVAWPLLRLSSGNCVWPLRRTALDLVVLTALTQVVVWPLRLVTPWSVDRTLVISVTLTAWTALVGAVVASASRGGPGVRTWGMLLCILLCLGGPIAAAGAALAGFGLPEPSIDALRSQEFLLRLSPFTAMQQLTAGGPGASSPADRSAALAAALAAAAAWLVAGGLGLSDRGGQDRAPAIC